MNSSCPIPVPNAVISVPTSAEDSILSNRAFSTFNIFPFSGSIAWLFLSRPCFAEPPAESPSTINSSEKAGSFSWQSANLPGRPAISNAPFRLVISLAFLAASLALAASIILLAILFASAGFSSRYSCNFSDITDSTIERTSDETNLSFVCEENFGSGTLTERIAVSPSLASSPVVFALSFFPVGNFSMY